MDSSNINSVKVEKANAIMRYHRIRKIANLFRFVEVCVVLILLSRFSSRLPVAVKIFSEYFQDLFVVLISPRFVFVVGNAIIITLFAKSGQFSGQTSTGTNAVNDLYDEVVKKSENCQKQSKGDPIVAPEPEDAVYEDKQTVREDYTVIPAYRKTITMVTDTVPATKVYRRSLSENLKRQNSVKARRGLRRSETETCRKFKSIEAKPEEMSEEEDCMSNEEFRRKIEAFIAKQQRFLREESLAISLHRQS